MRIYANIIFNCARGNLFLTYVILFGIVFSPLFVQSQKLRFKRYTVEDGLQNNIVFASTQDAKGLIWLSTATGIDRFDGNSFNHYQLPLKENSFTNYIQVPFLLTDKKKQVWAASANSIYLYNQKKDIFELPAELNRQIGKGTTITSFNSGYEGSLLLVGTNNGFFIYDPESKQVSSARGHSKYIRYIFQDNLGVIWVGTNKGVALFLINGNVVNELKNSLPALKSISNYPITGISQDRKNRYWIVTAGHGIFIYNSITNVFQALQVKGDIFKNFAVKDVCHSGISRYSYVATDGAGVTVIDDSLKVLNTNLSNDDDLATLSNNATYDIFADSYNRIWITTYGGGINVTIPSVQPFKNFVHEINNNNSLSNNAAKAISQDGEGNIWFGTRKGISRFNPKTNNWLHINEGNRSPQYSADNVLFVTTDGQKEIWSGTYGGGLIKISADGSVIKSYRNNPADISTIGTDYIYAVLHDSKKRVWSGGIRGPLSYFDKVTGKFFRIKTSVSQINCLTETSNGSILAGIEKGVFEVRGDSLVNFFPGKITERVLTIMEYSPGRFWLGTLGGGIIIINQEKGIEQILKAEDGLPANVICGIIKDKNGDVWIGTSRGIAHYQAKTQKITTYSKADGLAGTQINYNAFFQTKKGELFFGTTDGFSMFNPQSIKAKDYQPVIVFNGLTVNNKLMKPGNAESPLQEQLDELETLTLKHYQNSISIDFINTSPALSGTHLYSWKLEGFDKNWSQPSAIPVAAYTNLNSGIYTLLVRAISKGQTVEAKIKRLHIIIITPWWKTSFAFIVYFLMFAGAILAIYNYYNIRTARRKYGERLRLNTGLSHELRTPLTLVKGPINALVNATGLTEEEKSNLQLAKKNIEKLEAIISQFVDFQKTGMNKLQMQVKKQDILVLLDDITASFSPLIKEKNIHFTYKRPSANVELLFDKDKMEKVFNNLLSNAVKYTPAYKDIAIEVIQESRYLTIHVRDTGIGIPHEQQHLLFKGYFRADNTLNLKETGSGIGLNLVKELVELHHGKVNFISKKGQGSVFTVKLLLQNDALIRYVIKEDDSINIVPLLPSEKPGADKTANKTILIAEDNDELREYLKTQLTQAGYKVHAALNGKIAWQIIPSVNPDILITDAMMPEMNGFQLCKAVKKELNTCHIPVIILTAIHDKDYMVEGYRSGADDYVKKPFDLTYIIARIENLLENRTRFRNKIMSVFEQGETVAENDAQLKWLKKATEIILENMDKPDFSVEKLSSLMATSRPVLFRKFKAITDESPQQYINQIRLRRAVELLKQRQLTITEIGFECGFADPKYFSTVFKKHFGKTPSDYLKEANL